MQDSIYWAFFGMGLLGGGLHCPGMCGGIVNALTFSLPPTQRAKLGNLLPILLAYNVGRISGYMVAGAVVGGLFSAVTHLPFSNIETVRQVLQIMSALFMIALGLYIAGIWFGIAKVENAGRILWRHIEPLGRRFIPVDSPLKALPLGLVWGWLPCGLVYTVLISTSTAGSALKGALIMLSFGLGTLPSLLLMGAATSVLMRFTRQPMVKRMAGLLVVALGVLLLWQAIR